MKKFLSFFSAVALMLSFSMLRPEKTFSQTAQQAVTTGTNKPNQAALFNEGGHVRGITPARLIGLAELVLGILSIVFALRAKKQSSIKAAKNALRMGLLALVFSIVHFLTTAGAVFGSGSGKAGAILAMLFGLAGIILSRAVLRKNRL